MKYIDYMQLNPFQRAGYKISQFFINLPKNIVRFFKFIGRAIAKFFMGIGKGIANYFTRFVKGDVFTKLSYILMGAGNIFHGQVIKGFIFLLIEAAYICFMIFFGGSYLIDFTTLGTHEPYQEKNAAGFWVDVAGDNSMKILLYGVLTIVITIVFFVVYIMNTKSAYNTYLIKKEGKKPASFRDEIKQLLDERFHTTLLSFPVLTISIFTILPLIFMILIAFTNYDSHHTNNFFDWVGFQTFGEVFDIAGGAKKAYTFVELAKWTIIWAVAATFTNYIGGMIIALMINKKGIKLKSLWRTLFVVTVAVPQFVSLILISQMLKVDGAVNIILQNLHWIDKPINFFGSDPWLARITLIIVNCWVGIPYTILITSGILMNIPADLYESATIDGAGPVKSFTKITLPYMLFVTTPYLITTFIGNINNFNVIYLLSNGDPGSTKLYQAGQTDILVTWLFKLTMNYNDNNLAATVGILVFVVCATLSLITFNLTKSAKNEEEFS